MTWPDPNDPTWRMLREFERQRAWPQDIEASQRTLNPFAADLERLHRQHEEANRREERLRASIGPIAYLKHLQDTVEGYRIARENMETLTAAERSFNSALERARVDNERWAVVARNSAAHSRAIGLESTLIDSTLASYSAGVRDVMRAVETRQLGASNPSLAAHLFQPLESFSSYAFDALERAMAAGDNTRRAAASAGLALADSQISSAAEIVATLAQRKAGEDRDETDADTTDANALTGGFIPPPSGLVETFFVLQEAELRATGAVLTEPSKRAKTIEGLSRRAGTSRRQREITELLIACNEAAQLAGHGPVFRPSDKLLSSVSQLGWIYSDDFETLGRLVDHLFMALYESGGGKRPRYAQYLTPPEYRIVAVVAQLRHKVFRHDIEQGAAAGLPFQWRELAENLAVIGEQDVPRTAEECLRVHDKLIEESVIFLQLLLGAIRNRNS
jgi:hypothetical protein